MFFNYIFLATDSGDCVLLVHLTVAFDTVYHKILISWLEQGVGIIGPVLHWVSSVLLIEHSV